VAERLHVEGAISNFFDPFLALLSGENPVNLIVRLIGSQSGIYSN
jgi:hypothetical protein